MWFIYFLWSDLQFSGNTHKLLSDWFLKGFLKSVHSQGLSVSFHLSPYLNVSICRLFPRHCPHPSVSLLIGPCPTDSTKLPKLLIIENREAEDAHFFKDVLPSFKKQTGRKEERGWGISCERITILEKNSLCFSLESFRQFQRTGHTLFDPYY